MSQKPLCLNHQEQQNCHILKNRSQFPYQYSVSDQLLNLLLHCMNMKTNQQKFPANILKILFQLIVGISTENELVEFFSKYFGNIVQNLGVDGLTNTSSDNDPDKTSHWKISKPSQYKSNMRKHLNLKFISTKKFSIDFSVVYSFKILHGMSSRT